MQFRKIQQRTQNVIFWLCRIKEFIYSYKSYDGKNMWEQPYYKWESDLPRTSYENITDASQSFINPGFRPNVPFQHIPGEHRNLHWGIKK